MIVVLGVQLDCFTNVAKAKVLVALKMRFSVRTSHCKDGAEVSTLRQLLKRRQGAQLSMKNAITQWEFWRKDIREGLDLVDGFFDVVSQFDPWTAHIFCMVDPILMISIGEREGAENFLDMLADQILRDPPHFDKFIELDSKTSCWISSLSMVAMLVEDYRYYLYAALCRC